MNQKSVCLSFLLFFCIGGMVASNIGGNKRKAISVSENLEAFKTGFSNKQCWLNKNLPGLPCIVIQGFVGCSPCDGIVPPGPFPPPPSPPPTPAD